MKKWLNIIACFPAFFHFIALRANNLQLSAPSITGNDQMSFTISWDNSWNLSSTVPFNHDAVWIFVKYRAASGAWQHLDVSSISADHSVTTNTLAVDAVNDGKGVFVRRNAAGAGNNAPAVVNVKLLNSLPTGNYEFRIFGIEMVHVSEGAFYVGDSLSNNTFGNGNDLSPFFIASEDPIPVGLSAGELYNGGTYPPASNIPSAYPKGYDSFYCMKNEITQQQYVDFLNCLTYDQQATRTAIAPSSAAGTLAMTTLNANRNGIKILIPGIANQSPAVYGCDAGGNMVFDEIDDAQSRSCNFFSWADLAAYLDWSALRPMTEFEFEKVCRGPAYPVSREFAWATAFVVDANTLINDGTIHEAAADSIPPGYGIASHGYSGPQGPIRAGFAGNSVSDRQTIGAAYYGALEMSGNLWEMCVTVDAAGLQYSGIRGDGSISAAGDADAAGWPSANGTGAGFRGGAWNSGISSTFRDLAVSDRYYAGMAPSLRRNTAGGRGVR